VIDVNNPLEGHTMNHSELKQAGRAQAADIASLAAQGVQRALAARMTELTAQQVQAVSGAAALTTAATLAYDGYCGTGVRPFPKLTGAGGLAGGVVVIINGQYPQLNTAAIGAIAVR
jgi:hypothetical protein